MEVVCRLMELKAGGPFKPFKRPQGAALFNLSSEAALFNLSSEAALFILSSEAALFNLSSEANPFYPFIRSDPSNNQ